MDNRLTSCWKFSARLSDLYSRNPATFRGKTFFGKLQTFLVPLFFEQFFFSFPESLWAGSPKLRPKCQRIISWRNNCCEKKLFISSNCFQIWAKPFGPLAETVGQRCQNCSLYDRGTNWGKQYFEKQYNTNRNFGIHATSFRVFRGNFRQFCIKCNVCARGTFWRKTFVLEKKWNPKRFWDSGRKVFARFVNSLCYIPRGKFHKKEQFL